MTPNYDQGAHVGKSHFEGFDGVDIGLAVFEPAVSVVYAFEGKRGMVWAVAWARSKALDWLSLSWSK